MDILKLIEELDQLGNEKNFRGECSLPGIKEKRSNSM